MKKINFLAWTNNQQALEHNPFPAKQNLPKWYKSMPSYFGDNKERLTIFSNRNTNMTVKACPPFLDAMIAGYTISLNSDLFVENENGSVRFVWGHSEVEVISDHAKAQVPKAIMTPEYFDQPFKFINDWSIQLPEGYSALFMHPANRIDLPFYTLSGIVDCDSFHVPVTFPFLLKNNFSGIIPAGTPIAQVFPFKRESWNHSVSSEKDSTKNIKKAMFLKKLYKSYKNSYWHKKSYD